MPVREAQPKQVETKRCGGHITRKARPNVKVPTRRLLNCQNAFIRELRQVQLLQAQEQM